MKMKVVLFLLLFTGVGTATMVRADYAFPYTGTLNANDFLPAFVGASGALPGPHNAAYITSNGTLRLEGRYRQQATRALAIGDDGTGNNYGNYASNVVVSVIFQYFATGSLLPDSTNVTVGMGIRQNSNSGANTYPVYQAFIVTNTITLGKRYGFEPATGTNYATYTLPATIGGTNLYTIQFSATEQGTNVFGEIVDVHFELFENGASLAELQFTDTPITNTFNNLGASRPSGYTSLMAGGTPDTGSMSGIDVIEYAVQSDPDLETLRVWPVHTAMAVGMTNRIMVSRGGDLSSGASVDLVSSDPAVADVPADIEIDGGSFAADFLITAQALGTTVVTASNSGYPDATATVKVFDLGYDGSSYAQLGVAFTNGGNSGAGFQPWVLYNNNGANTNGVGYTNFAGAFLGNSRLGGVSVNENEWRSFALFADGRGDGAPLSEAVRPLSSALAVGQAVSVNIGINIRNGYKGVALRNSGTQLFEVYAGLVVTNDAYMYKVGTNDAVVLNWAYNSNTRITIDVKRVAPELYDITLIRGGGLSTNENLGIVNLGALPPNEFRFYVFSAQPGAQNNLYFDQLALYSGYQLEGPVELSIDGFDGVVAGTTNLFTVNRTGSTDDALTVDLSSDDALVLTVPASVEIGIGLSNATFEVVGVSNGIAVISADALDVIGDTFTVAVVDIAYDDTTYYPPAMFESAGNGGTGFQPWVISLNDGPGDGFTNFVGTGIGDSSTVNGNINSSKGDAFFLYANGDGTDEDAPLAQALRDFAALAVGTSISVDLGVNYRNGAKGVMFQAGDTWLFEFAVFNDAYHYNVRDGGGDSPVDLGWDYAGDSAINVVLSRTGDTTYNARFMRTGSSETQTLVQAISLSQAPDRMRFYVYDTDGGGDENNLFINRLIQLSGIVGEASMETDGIPNSWWDRYGILGGDRVASADPDDDDEDNLSEYIADTDPTDGLSKFPNLVSSIAGGQAMTLQTGPTTNSRVYDVWWTTNLMANPQAWVRYGLSVTGNGGSVSLQVTNDAPMRVYRTGVALPD